MLESAFNAAMAGLLGAGIVALLIFAPFYIYQHRKDVKFLLKQEQLGLLSDADLKKLAVLRSSGKIPAATTKSPISSKAHIFKSALNAEVGDVLKKYKGFAIVKQAQGVSVSDNLFSNVIEAESWIDRNWKSLSADTGTDAEAVGGNEIVSVRDGKDFLNGSDEGKEFLIEALRMYKNGHLSEAAVLEIMQNKR